MDQQQRLKFQQMQKQFALTQISQRTESIGSTGTSSNASHTNSSSGINNIDQEWQISMANALKKQPTSMGSNLNPQQLLQYYYQSNLSPSESSTDEWFSNVSKQTSAVTYRNGQYDEALNHVNKMHQAISPAQSIESSSSNGQNQWPNCK